MEWLNRMNEAIEYIEMHLENEISYEQIAKIAQCSTYHFQRMFPYIAGISLSEYIRRRRLTMAAFDIQSSSEKIINVSLKYGYESPEAFSRAFRLQHGISPSQARNIGANLKAYPRITLSISIKGDVAMNYRIVEREAFKVFGVYELVSTNRETAFKQVPEFCQRCDETGIVDEMNGVLGRFNDNYTMAGLFDFDESNFKYMLCNYLPNTLPLPDKFVTLSVPKATWAVFDSENCDVQTLWQRVWNQWLPISNFEVVEGPQFEMYYGMAEHKNGFGEIWIPVQQKK